MGLIETLILLGLGFIAFFATGIDDTMAYASLYLQNKKKNHKKLISLGILIGTIIALCIAVLAGRLMENVPSRHLIGGAVLIALGIMMFTRGWRGLGNQLEKAHLFKVKKHLNKTRSKKNPSNIRFIFLGMVFFFATGIDDILAYSNLIIAKSSWLGICIGVLIATFVSLLIAHTLAGKLKKLSHPEKIGGTIIIIMGILLAMKIL